jgi:5S rRNA maturation endonuclease (ribonuclease M5)
MSREEIIAANPIVDFVRNCGHELKRAGKNFVTNASPVTQHKRGHRPVMIYPENNSWFDHDLKLGGSVIDWVMHERGCDAVQAMRELSGNNGAAQIVATYDYTDEGGNLLFQCVRSKPKDFWQRRPDGKGGWINNLQGVRRVLYRLPQVIAASTVCVAEGEKDCDNLAKLGFVATTNPLGAGNWRDEYSETLCGKDVIVFGDVGDKDGKGEKHTQHVIESLTGKAKSIKRVKLPDKFHDVSDYIASLPPETARDTIRKLIDETPEIDLTAGELSKDAEPDETPSPPPQYGPPPLDLLPSVLQEYVIAAAESLNVDVAFILLPMLSSLGAAIGNACSIVLKRDFIQPPVIWTGIIGRSGSRKSPSLDAGCKGVMEHERELIHQNKQAEEQYAEDLAAWEAKDKKARGTKPEAKDPLTCVMDKLTFEVLADKVEANRRGVLIKKDELSHWFESFDQYHAAKGADVSQWLSLHTGVLFAFDRRSDKRSYRIWQPRVNVTGGIQPKVFRRILTPDYFERGLPARFLLASPPFRQDRWSEATIPDEIREAALNLFEQLWLLQPNHDEHNQPRPKLLPLDADAKAVFVAFYDDCGVASVERGEHEEAAWCKLTGYAARLALVGQLAADPQSQTITGETMQAACDLARWFGNEAVRIYAELAETREQREQRELCEFIERRGETVTERDLVTYYRPIKNLGAGGTEKATEMLNDLVKNGCGKWEQSRPSGRGRPTRIFRLLLASASAKITDLRGKTPNCADADTLSSQKNEGSWGPENEPVSGGLDAMPAGILEL